MLPTQQVDILLLLRNILHKLFEVFLLSNIARSNSEKKEDQQRLRSKLLTNNDAYGMISPPSFGSCDLAAFSSTSIRRPVM